MQSDINQNAVITCAYSTLQKPFEKHFHNAHEMIYVCSGHAKIQIEEKTYDLKPHTIVFISNLEEHSVQIIEEPYLRYYVQLSPSQLDRLVDDPKLKSVFISRFSPFNHCFYIDEIAMPIERIFQELVKEYENPDSFSSNYISTLLNQVMILCYRLRKDQFPLLKKHFGQSVFDAKKYIDQNFDQELSVTELSEKLYISPSYLSHAFKEWTGYSPKQYIMLSRIAYSKELLINSKLSVSEVAIKSGFGDCNNFIRSFKTQCGVTPNQYRKSSI